MRTIYFACFIIISTMFISSCSKSDPYDGTVEPFSKPVLSDATPVDSRVKQLFNTYGVYFKPEFPLSDYTWNWNQSVRQTAADVTGMRYTPADRNYAIEVMDSVENWVFKVFPPEFSKKYMPLNILMTDTMMNKFLSGTTVVPRIYEGFIATNYILISYVSPRFDVQKQKRMLRESWLSLFVEKMAPGWPVPADFVKVSKTAYEKLNFTNAEDVMVSYALLKKGRTKQITSAATAAWNKTSPEQDFGDFVAFIVYTPETEKQTVYSKNANILIKVNLVKSYFRDHFGIELPYLPVNP